MADRRGGAAPPRVVAPRLRTLPALERAIPKCEACPRLRAHCAEVAGVRRRAYADETYWGRPVPGFGDPAARLLVVGLAPAAHGANRTGRMFTGDRSGDFLFAALHRAGLANQPTSLRRADGLALSGVFISAAARCAPPGNALLPDEAARCRPWLTRELALLPNLRVAVSLGRVGHDAFLRAVGLAPRDFPWAHGAEHALPGAPRHLVGSFHVSQQNTFTGRLTPPMLDAIFERAKALAGRR